MKNIIKRMASALPSRWQQQLKRLHFARQLKKGRFVTDESEFNLLPGWLENGDWVIDVGANIGHYTVRFSEHVGRKGRVIALEPVPQTFELLAANSSLAAHQNITLLNVAGSDAFSSQGISIPKFNTGLDNYYQAQLSDTNSSVHVLCLPLDSLDLSHRIKLVKIDAEGHEYNVLKGMTRLLERDHPILIIEDNSDDVIALLDEFGYSGHKEEGSPNTIFQHSPVT